MNNKIHNLFTTLKRPGLSKDEKETLRNALIGHINGTAPLTSQLQQSRRQNYRSSSILMTWRYHVALASFLIVATSGAGIVSAAEGALPGDLLYSIKTRLNEPVVRLVKATTPISRALFETHLLEKRLAEAEQLDTQNALSNGVKAVVKTEVVAQKARAEKAAKSIGRDMTSKVRVANQAKKTATQTTMSARSAPEEVTFSLTASAPADQGSSTAGAAPMVAVQAVTENAEADAVVTADVITTEEFASEVPPLEKVYEKHRLILEKLEVKTHEELEEAPF